MKELRSPGAFQGTAYPRQMAQGTILVADLKTGPFCFPHSVEGVEVRTAALSEQRRLCEGQPSFSASSETREPREVRGGTVSFLLQHTFLLTDGPSLLLY